MFVVRVLIGSVRHLHLFKGKPIGTSSNSIMNDGKVVLVTLAQFESVQYLRELFNRTIFTSDARPIENRVERLKTVLEGRGE